MREMKLLFAVLSAFLLLTSSASAGGVVNLTTRRPPPVTSFNLSAPRIAHYTQTVQGPMRHNIYLRQGQNGLMRGILGRLQHKDALVIRATDLTQAGRVLAQASPRALQGGRSYMVFSEQLVIKEAAGMTRSIRIDSQAAQVLKAGGRRAEALIERAIQRLDVQKGFPRSLTVRGGSLGLDVLEPGGRSAFVVIEHNVIPRLLPGHTDRGSMDLADTRLSEREGRSGKNAGTKRISRRSQQAPRSSASASKSSPFPTSL